MEKRMEVAITDLINSIIKTEGDLLDINVERAGLLSPDSRIARDCDAKAEHYKYRIDIYLEMLKLILENNK